MATVIHLQDSTDTFLHYLQAARKTTRKPI